MIRPAQALLLVAAGLAAALAWEIARPPLNWLAEVATPPASVESDKSPSAIAATVPPRQAYRELDARPLFVASRRPIPKAPPQPPAPVAPPPPPAPPPAALDGFVLVGIMTTSAQHVAVIRIPASPAPQRVTVGQIIGGWEVGEILRDRVRLRTNGTIRELTFPKAGQAQPGRGLPQASPSPVFHAPPAPARLPQQRQPPPPSPLPPATGINAPAMPAMAGTKSN